MTQQPELKERDAMVCRACGREERASEGYPCTNCGTFICIICSFRGITLCAQCAGTPGGSVGSGADAPKNPAGGAGPATGGAGSG